MVTSRFKFLLILLFTLSFGPIPVVALIASRTFGILPTASSAVPRFLLFNYSFWAAVSVWFVGCEFTGRPPWKIRYQGNLSVDKRIRNYPQCRSGHTRT